jgi:hypothetical protein
MESSEVRMRALLQWLPHRANTLLQESGRARYTPRVTTRERLRSTGEFEALPFDRVEIGKGAGIRVLMPLDYLAIPLAERVRALIDGEVAFRRGDAVVDSAIALKAITAAFKK